MPIGNSNGHAEGWSKLKTRARTSKSKSIMCSRNNIQIKPEIAGVWQQCRDCGAGSGQSMSRLWNSLREANDVHVVR